jgi:Tfp pilus assembly protein PilV
MTSRLNNDLLSKSNKARSRSSNDSMESERNKNQRRSFRARSNEKQKRASVILNNYKIEFDACNSACKQTNQERTDSENTSNQLEIDGQRKKSEKSLYIVELSSDKLICKPSASISVQNDFKHFKSDAYERTIFKLSGNHFQFIE